MGLDLVNKRADVLGTAPASWILNPRPAEVFPAAQAHFYNPVLLCVMKNGYHLN
jgi:hypothetical protein